MRKYDILHQTNWTLDTFNLVPLRDEDKYLIMKWRNEQLFHLRQEKPLTKEEQEHYFATVIQDLFRQEKPNQLLFSLLENDQLVGYGGLVHINWTAKNAEISFVMNTELEPQYFAKYWSTFLRMLETIAFKALGFLKIFTYAYDLRPQLYPILIERGFEEEARLKFHKEINGVYIDVLIHSKINTPQPNSLHEAHLRLATKEDCDLLFLWANDQQVRQNAKNTSFILFKDHVNWFNNKLQNENSALFILEYQGKPIGQIRVDLVGDAWVIDYSIDKLYRGMGYGSHIVRELIKIDRYNPLTAFVKKENLASSSVFQKLGFKLTANNESYVEFSRFA